MEETAVKWIEQNKGTIESFMDGLGEYKQRNDLSKVTGTPVINILMLPCNRTERRFTVANLASDDAENPNVLLTPSEGQELTLIVTRKLNEMFPAGTFTIRRNKEFAIYIKFTEVQDEGALQEG